MNMIISICARGGSKRIKDKNIQEVCGKPLVAYAVDLAKKWGKGKRIVCSTDSEKIAEIAKAHGAEVPFMRPAELASDAAGKVAVIRHLHKACEEIYGEKIDCVVDLDATNPLKTVEDLNNCLKIYEEKKPEILFTVTNARRNPYFNMVEAKDDGFVKLSKTPEKTILRTQDTPKVYDMNAAIYFYSREFLLDPNKTHPLKSDKAAISVMDEITAVDIDTEFDLKYVEFVLNNNVVKI